MCAEAVTGGLRGLPNSHDLNGQPEHLNTKEKDRKIDAVIDPVMRPQYGLSCASSVINANSTCVFCLSKHWLRET